MIFHCQAKVVSRAAGRSATAAAAYRASDKIIDERTGTKHDYSKKAGLVHQEIIAPDGEAAPSRAKLWNAAEAAENRKNSTTAREWEIALPAEGFTDKEREGLARQFAQWLVRAYRVVADVCIHAPNKKGDQRNFHAHILSTTRAYEGGKLTAKTRALDALDGGKEVKRVREAWAGICNAALERKGLTARISAASLKEQGVEDRLPTVHVGPKGTAMERKGKRTWRSDRNRRNVEAQPVLAEIAALENELADRNRKAEVRQVARDELAAGRAAASEKFAAARAAARQKRAEDKAAEQAEILEKQRISRENKRGLGPSR